jgi:hypothetical protein
MIESGLVLFSPSQTLATWGRGNPSLETRSQVEALLAFIDAKKPVCLLCGGPLKPIGLMGVIGPPDAVRESFAVCKPCSSGDEDECDQRIFDALGITVVRGPNPERL